ncbi:hypothetical protein LSAT2_015549, partial [Lamellibrachia satsuma]
MIFPPFLVTANMWNKLFTSFISTETVEEEGEEEEREEEGKEEEEKAEGKEEGEEEMIYESTPRDRTSASDFLSNKLRTWIKTMPLN